MGLKHQAGHASLSNRELVLADEMCESISEQMAEQLTHEQQSDALQRITESIIEEKLFRVPLYAATQLLAKYIPDLNEIAYWDNNEPAAALLVTEAINLASKSDDMFYLLKHWTMLGCVWVGCDWGLNCDDDGNHVYFFEADGTEPASFHDVRGDFAQLLKRTGIKTPVWSKSWEGEHLESSFERLRDFVTADLSKHPRTT